MRKPLAVLLILPFLAGANPGDAAPSGAGAGIETVAAGTTVAQPSLPGHVASSGVTLPSTVPGSDTHDSWRSPARSRRMLVRGHTAATHLRDARTLIASLRLESLAFRHSLVHARTSEPATSGNPPPVSPT
jgi:hypothetical protein